MADITNRKLIITSSAGPSSYTTGGFDVSCSELSVVDGAFVVSSTGGYISEVVSTTGNSAKVKVYSAQGTEVASATDLSGETFSIMAYGL